MIDIDKETLKLTNEIRDVLGRHITKVSTEANYKEVLTSCIIALSIEVGRIRWLSTSTEEIDEEIFDKVFWEGATKHFNENKMRYGADISPI